MTSTGEYVGIQFGGDLGAVPDPATRASARSRAFGKLAYRVEDLAALSAGLGGGDQLDDETVARQVKTIVMQVLKERFVAMVMRNRWSLAEVVAGAHNAAIEAAVTEAAGPRLAPQGLRLTEVSIAGIQAQGVEPARAPAAAPASGPLAAGTRVMAKHQGCWYEATVSRSDADVAQVTWDTGATTPVSYDDLQPLRAAPTDGAGLFVGQRVIAGWQGVFHDASISSLGSGQAVVRWQNGNESTIPLADIRLIQI